MFLQTAAHEAVEAGHVDCLRALAQHGADLNALGHSETSIVESGLVLGPAFTPAGIAALSRRMECLQFLAEHGADLNRADKLGGVSPQHRAST